MNFAMNEQTLQLAIVLLCVLAAVVWWGRRLWAVVKRRSQGLCGGGCDGCGSSSKNTGPLVSLEAPLSGASKGDCGSGGLR